MVERNKDLEKVVTDLEKERQLDKAVQLLIQASDMAELAEHHFTQPEPIRCKWCGSVDIKKYGSKGWCSRIPLSEMRAEV